MSRICLVDVHVTTDASLAIYESMVTISFIVRIDCSPGPYPIETSRDADGDVIEISIMVSRWFLCFMILFVVITPLLL